MELSAASSKMREEDVFLLAQTLNGAWGQFIRATPFGLRSRIESGHLFVVARDRATPDELSYIRATYGLAPDDGLIPIGLLETIDAVTGGDARQVPPTYAALTSAGAWRRPLPAADTQVFVDLTTATSRRQSGIGRDIVRFALAHRDRRHRHVFTFTPNVDAIVRWHLGRGARHSGVVLPAARPGHSQPDVALMDYSHARPEDVT
jgi:hypothetical protein